MGEAADFDAMMQDLQDKRAADSADRAFREAQDKAFTQLEKEYEEQEASSWWQDGCPFRLKDIVSGRPRAAATTRGPDHNFIREIS